MLGCNKRLFKFEIPNEDINAHLDPEGGRRKKCWIASKI
jgi:hypothetical protein